MTIPSKRSILLTLLAILIVIQIFRIDKTNPPIDTQIDFATITNTPTDILEKLKGACYDCHSHETEYPWYTNVQPVAWLIKGHIKGGRQHLNYSEWGSYNSKKKSHKIEEIIEEVESRRMPMKSFTWMHEDASLSDDDIKQISTWLRTLE